ncbi:MAG: Calx-beta domain-containing protein [Mycobacterium sp.]
MGSALSFAMLAAARREGSPRSGVIAAAAVTPTESVKPVATAARGGEPLVFYGRNQGLYALNARTYYGPGPSGAAPGAWYGGGTATNPVGYKFRVDQIATAPDGDIVYAAVRWKPSNAQPETAWLFGFGCCNTGGPAAGLRYSKDLGGGQSRGLAVSPDSKRVYVLQSDLLSVAGSGALRQYDLVMGPLRAMALSPDGSRLYVLRKDGNISALDTAKLDPALPSPGGVEPIKTVQRVFPHPDGGSFPAEDSDSLAISPDGRTLYVSNWAAGVNVIDTETLQVIGPVTVDGKPLGPKNGFPALTAGMAVSPDGARLYIAQQRVREYGPGALLVVDTATSTVINTLAPPRTDGFETITLQHVAVSPDGYNVFVRGTGNPNNWIMRYVPGEAVWTADGLAQSWPTPGNGDAENVQSGGLAVGPHVEWFSPYNNAPTKLEPVINPPAGADGVVRGQVRALDRDGDAVAFEAYSIPPPEQLADGTDRFTTARGGVVTVKPSGEFTYTPSVAAQEKAARVGAPALDRYDTFGVRAYDRTPFGYGGITVIPVTVPIQPALPSVSISPATLTVAEGNSGTSAASFTVTLSKTPTTAVTVNYATANGTATAGSDYTAKTGTVSFAANTTTLSQSVPVSITGDTVVESDETFTVTLTSAAGASLGAVKTSRVTIRNDDTAPVSPPTINITASGGQGTLSGSQREGNGSGVALRFLVSLSSTADRDVTVDWYTVNGTAIAGQDYGVRNNSTRPEGSVTIYSPQTTAKDPTKTNAVPLGQYIAVPVLGDTTKEQDESFTVVLVTRDVSYPKAGVMTATGTILNDD